MTQIKMGALYLDNVAQINPQNPTFTGDIPKYDGTSTITIADVPKNCPDALIAWNVVHNMEEWSCTGTLLIADRVLLSYVSWDDLAAAGFIDGVEIVLEGRKYRCHLLPMGELFNSPNAWDDALNQTKEDNATWHWKHICFWMRDIVSNHKISRGYFSARDYDRDTSFTRSELCGFRPALEPLDCTDPVIS